MTPDPTDVRQALDAGMSLTRTLAHLGYRTSPADHPIGAKHIHGPGGVVVYTGTADEVWAWLRGMAAARET